MRVAAIAAALAWLVAAQAAPPAAAVTWRLNNLTQFAADRAEAIGSPTVVSTEIGPAIQFNGVSDGLLIARNPLERLPQFTIEVLLSPDAAGPVEQRFLHVQEHAGDS